MPTSRTAEDLRKRGQAIMAEIAEHHRQIARLRAEAEEIATALGWKPPTEQEMLDAGSDRLDAFRP